MSGRGSWWSITINNPTQQDYEKLKSPRDFVREMWYQTEVGEEGTKHIQCCINTTQQRFSAIKQWLDRAHIELARNKEALKKYCRKSETSVPGTFVHWPDSQTNEIEEEEPVAIELHEILHQMTDYLTASIVEHYVTDMTLGLNPDEHLYRYCVQEAYRLGHNAEANAMFGRNVKQAFLIAWRVFFTKHLETRLIESAQEEIAQTDRQEPFEKCMIVD